MSTIDHRVLINAPPSVVWELLGDLTSLPKWHINCTHTSILTTDKTGVGARRRSTMQRGPDVIEEITAWYAQLGYEYVLVDSGMFKSNHGRVRLQAIPEGTIVQWTIEYTLKGLFAPLVDLLFVRRRLNNEVLDSLKRMKKLVEATGIRMDAATRDRVSMRPAPSASERAALAETISQQNAEKESTSTEVRARSDAAPASAAPALEAIFDDDIPPMPESPVEPEHEALDTPADDVPAVAEISRPEAVDEIFTRAPAQDAVEQALESGNEPDVDESDITPEPVEPGPAVALEAEEPETAVEPPAADESAVSEPEIAEQPDESDAQETVTPESEEEAAEPVEAAKPAIPPVPEPLDMPAEPMPSVFQQDLKPVGPSIWDVFGVQRPGEEPTAESSEPAAEPAPDSAEPASPSEQETPTRHRIRSRVFVTHPGLRRIIARQLSQVRHR